MSLLLLIWNAANVWFKIPVLPQVHAIHASTIIPSSMALCTILYGNIFACYCLYHKVCTLHNIIVWHFACPRLQRMKKWILIHFTCLFGFYPWVRRIAIFILRTWSSFLKKNLSKINTEKKFFNLLPFQWRSATAELENTSFLARLILWDHRSLKLFLVEIKVPRNWFRKMWFPYVCELVLTLSETAKLCYITMQQLGFLLLQCPENKEGWWIRFVLLICQFPCACPFQFSHSTGSR